MDNLKKEIREKIDNWEDKIARAEAHGKAFNFIGSELERLRRTQHYICSSDISIADFCVVLYMKYTFCNESYKQACQNRNVRTEKKA